MVLEPACPKKGRAGHGQIFSGGTNRKSFSYDTTRTDGDRAKRSFKVQACCYLGPRSALVYSSSVSPSSVMLVPTNHNPGYTSQCILQVALVDPINEHQQIIGIVKELSSIDCGADQPFLTVTGQRLGMNTENFAGCIGRQEERLVALTAQVFKQQQPFAQQKIRLDETFELFGGDKPIDAGSLFGFHG